ncbi:unnamed protein product [Cuscuta epithymum]|uniref:DUF4371 domain-containing protein n=1 Tax=Cuscuta epithymum TaxID=186058 RepID=A0AAV0FXI6_9ASTE|nr:unnamed protein product [Cuscuta epithymum]
MLSLLLDESSDVSYKEQLAVVLRYVDRCRIVKERFIGVVHVKDTSSLSLKVAIDSIFSEYSLSLKNVRGQGYDGASNMQASCKRRDMIRESHQEKVKEAISNGEISTGTGLNHELSLQRPGNTRYGSHYRTLLN